MNANSVCDWVLIVIYKNAIDTETVVSKATRCRKDFGNPAKSLANRVNTGSTGKDWHFKSMIQSSSELNDKGNWQVFMTTGIAKIMRAAKESNLMWRLCTSKPWIKFSI